MIPDEALQAYLGHLTLALLVPGIVAVQWSPGATVVYTTRPYVVRDMLGDAVQIVEMGEAGKANNFMQPRRHNEQARDDDDR